MTKKIKTLLLSILMPAFLLLPVAAHAQVVDVTTPTSTPAPTPTATTPAPAPTPTTAEAGKGAGVPATGVKPKNHNVGANLAVFLVGSLLGLGLSTGIVFTRKKYLQK